MLYLASGSKPAGVEQPRGRFPARAGEAPGPAGIGLARHLFKKWCGCYNLATGKRAVKKSDRRLGGWRHLLGFARTEARPR
ncbi:MAG TPA: hypothetical protein VFV38_43725, partial [Ktedonobacteraceae bacterium]|nr:hypothetical protein [Ktedonobacteraceae bacterium]